MLISSVCDPQDDQERDLEVTAQIPLTLALIERYLAGKISDIGPHTVVEYLKAALHWRVTAVCHPSGLVRPAAGHS